MLVRVPNDLNGLGKLHLAEVESACLSLFVIGERLDNRSVVDKARVSECRDCSHDVLLFCVFVVAV